MIKIIHATMMLCIASCVNATMPRVPIGDDNKSYTINNTLTSNNLKINYSSIQSDTAAYSNELNLCGKPNQTDYPILIIALEHKNTSFIYSDNDIKNKIFGLDNSVKDYFLKSTNSEINIIEANSGNINGFLKIKIDNDHPAVITEDMNEKLQLSEIDVMAAIKKIVDNELFDFSSFDANNDNRLSTNELGLHFIVAGYEESYSDKDLPNLLWGHKSSLSGIYNNLLIEGYSLNSELFSNTILKTDNELFTIGLPSHELGHLLFCLPDLYYINENKSFSGILGPIDLMSSGSWNSISGDIQGTSPSFFSSFSLSKMNLLDENAIQQIKHIDEKHELVINDISSNAIFRKNEFEHYFFEGRGNNVYDAGIIDSGAVITKVTNKNGNIIVENYLESPIVNSIKNVEIDSSLFVNLSRDNKNVLKLETSNIATNKNTHTKKKLSGGGYFNFWLFLCLIILVKRKKTQRKKVKISY